MAVYSGIKVPDYLDEVAYNPNGTANLDGRTTPRYQALVGWVPDSKPAGGALQENQPIPGYPATVFSGQRACTFFDDLYNRVYFFPSSVDFGAVTDTTSQSVVVWNSYLTDIALNSIQEENGDGISLSGPAVPNTFLTLATATYEVVADVDGPATINTTYTFSFDPGGTFALEVTGTRAQLWPFEPNWRRPYRVGYEFKTSVIASHSGREQRRARRQTPRKTLEFTTTLKNRNELRQFQRLMTTWQHRSWVFPELTRRLRASVGMPTNGTVMGFDAIPPWLVTGMAVVLRYQGVSELRTVEAIAGTEVTFANSTATVWPAGTALHPGLAGFLDAQLQAPRLTNTVAEVQVRFSGDPGAEPPVDPPAAAVTLNGREVFLKRPNWAEQVGASAEHPVDLVDFEVGRIARYSPIDFPTFTHQATYVGLSSAQGEELLATYLRQKGQQGEFYMPTWEQDMTVAQGVSQNTTSIRMQGTALFDAYADDTVYRAIALLLTDGSVLVRAVTDLTVVSDQFGEDTLFSISEPWAFGFAPEQVVVACWMPVWRFASDGLTMEWLSNTVAQAKLSMRTLEDLPEETLQ